jgi:hypothetical protein
MPREQHAALFARIARRLRPGGRLLAEAGFELLHDELIAMREGDEREASFQWVLARGAPCR